MNSSRRSRRNRGNKEPEKVVEKVKEPLDINFGLEKERAGYINKKLNTILDEIGEEYGKGLTHELIKRLQRTITKFHSEVSDLLKDLSKIEEERISSEENIKAAENIPGDVHKMDEWEKKIELKDVVKEKNPKDLTEEEAKPKSGRRRKKRN